MRNNSRPANDGFKIRKEKKTVEKMIHLYCGKKHNPSNTSLCSECQSLLQYSHQKLENCQYGEDKPTCRECPVQCYSPTMRDEIRTVMGFSGPRLLFRAPMLWIQHKISNRDDVNQENEE